MEEPGEDEIGTGEETAVERTISNYLATVIHLFLSALAVLLVSAAAIAVFDTVVRDFPSLLRPPRDEYGVLLGIIENLLLIAITAEFALLLLFRRLSAAVEVVVFVLAAQNRQSRDYCPRHFALCGRDRRADHFAVLFSSGQNNLR